MKENDKRYTLGLILTALVCVAGIVLSVFAIINSKKFDIANFLEMLIYLLSGYYVIEGYRKPHGNLVKYLLWGFGFTLITRAISYATMSQVSAYLYGLAAVGVCYMSGKLNKLRNNIILGSSIFLLLLAGYIIAVCTSSQSDRFGVALLCAPIIQWAVVMGTYVLRFHLHKEAGSKVAKI